MSQIGNQRKDGFSRPFDEDGKVQIGHPFPFLLFRRLVEHEPGCSVERASLHSTRKSRQTPESRKSPFSRVRRTSRDTLFTCSETWHPSAPRNSALAVLSAFGTWQAYLASWSRVRHGFLQSSRGPLRSSGPKNNDKKMEWLVEAIDIQPSKRCSPLFRGTHLFFASTQAAWSARRVPIDTPSRCFWVRYDSTPFIRRGSLWQNHPAAGLGP